MHKPILVLATLLLTTPLAAEPPATAPATRPAVPVSVPATSTAPATDAKDVAIAFVRARQAYDIFAIRKTLATIRDPDLAALVDTTLRASCGKKLLRLAIGKQFPDSPKTPPRVEGEPLLRRLEAGELIVDGDTARLDGPDVLKLKKEAGAWKIDVEALANKDGLQRMLPNLPRLKAEAEAYEDITKRVESGQYKTAAEANDAVRAALQAATLKSTAQPTTTP